MPKFDLNIFWRLVVPVPFILLVGLVVAWIFIPPAIVKNAEDAAISSALQTAQQFKTIRGYYTKNVISKVVKSGVLKPSFNHATEPQGVPLPATFIHDMSDLLAKENTSIKLFSAFPFPHRGDRKLDEFQASSWEALNDDPKSVVSQRFDHDDESIVSSGWRWPT